MIPKIIHYCWFGGNALSDKELACINSWKKYCPEYEIIEWNEHNFNVNEIEYTRDAYACKKWAFVSDYARFKILYENGGLYFDTDVELIKPIDDIIKNGSFFGLEQAENSVSLGNSFSESVGVASGLGIGADAGLPIYREIIDFYKSYSFFDAEGEVNTANVVGIVSGILLKHGFQNKNILQTVEGITIYPAEYFAPLNYVTGKLQLTENTRSIHHYAGTWRTQTQQKTQQLQYKLIEKFGEKAGRRMAQSYGVLRRCIDRVNETGLRETILHYFKIIIKNR